MTDDELKGLLDDGVAEIRRHVDESVAEIGVGKPELARCSGPHEQPEPLLSVSLS